MPKNLPSLVLAIAPASEPLTLAETKAFLRIEGSADDSLVTRLIKVARQDAEKYLRRSLITQSWVLAYDEYTPSVVELPMGPVQSVTSVTLTARDGDETILNSATYYLTAGNRKLIFDASPISHRVEILYEAGYGVAADVPEPIKQGMLAHCTSMYDSRDSSASAPLAVRRLYEGYRVFGC